MKTVLTHTGKIYVDTEHRLEFLTVGDYGKENNIKADFLGLTKEINGVENTAVDLSKKWVATISTQKGCPMHCKFCDVPKFGFYGNASIEDMDRQIRTIIEGESVQPLVNYQNMDQIFYYQCLTIYHLILLYIIITSFTELR